MCFSPNAASLLATARPGSGHSPAFGSPSRPYRLLGGQRLDRTDTGERLVCQQNRSSPEAAPIPGGYPPPRRISFAPLCRTNGGGGRILLRLHTKAEVQSPPSSYLSLFYAHFEAAGGPGTVEGRLILTRKKTGGSAARARGSRRDQAKNAMACAAEVLSPNTWYIEVGPVPPRCAKEPACTSDFAAFSAEFFVVRGADDSIYYQQLDLVLSSSKHYNRAGVISLFLSLRSSALFFFARAPRHRPTGARRPVPFHAGPRPYLIASSSMSSQAWRADGAQRTNGTCPWRHSSLLRNLISSSGT
jgi:hypothetical protein